MGLLPMNGKIYSSSLRHFLEEWLSAHWGLNLVNHSVAIALKLFSVPSISAIFLFFLYSFGSIPLASSFLALSLSSLASFNDTWGYTPIA